MNKTNMYCIYHSRDLDGWMSAAIVMLWYERAYGDLDGLELIGWDYGDPLPELMPDRPVIMVDISFELGVMKDIGSTNELVWIDHHKSAILEFLKDDAILKEQWLTAELPTMGIGEELEEELELVGACELTWKKYFPRDEMPEIVRLLGCYDSFRHKGTVESGTVFDFQYAARANLTNPEECHKILKGVISIEGWCNMGAAILNYLKVEARSIYKNRTEHVFVHEQHKYKIAAINRERFNPSSYDIKYHGDGYDAFMCYSRMNDGRWTVSLYNEDGNVDVSVLAKSMGGGGHAGAAGMVVDNLDFLKFVR